MYQQVHFSFLGPRGPLVLPSIGVPVRPSARISSPPSPLSPFPSSPPSVLSLLVNAVTLVTPSPVTEVVVVIAIVVVVANDHLEWPTSCERSSGWAVFLQIIIRKGQPLANDHPEGPASCK